MTQIRSMAQPVQKRPGELGVHSLDAFNFMVPDLAAAEKFYGEFGLKLKEENGAISLYTHGHPHSGARCRKARARRCSYVSFGCFEEDMPKFQARIQEMRLDRLDPPKGFESNGIWLRDPSGMLVEIRVAEKSSPNEKSAVDAFGGKPKIQNAPNRSKAPRVHPRRLAHVLVFATDIPKTIEWYRDVLGMRLSDRSGDMIAFMHGIHGSDHHMIAFVKSDGPGLHHLLLGRRLDQRHRRSAPATWPTRALPEGLGARPPRARLELLPLRARPVGLLRGILLRHRLRAGRL